MRMYRPRKDSGNEHPSSSVAAYIVQGLKKMIPRVPHSIRSRIPYPIRRNPGKTMGVIAVSAVALWQGYGFASTPRYDPETGKCNAYIGEDYVRRTANDLEKEHKDGKSLQCSDLVGAEIGHFDHRKRLEQFDKNPLGAVGTWLIKTLNLEGIDLRGSKLDKARIHNVDLTGAKLDGISALETDWYGGQLDHVSVRKATFDGSTSFERVDFYRADFRDSEGVNKAKFINPLNVNTAQGLEGIVVIRE